MIVAVGIVALAIAAPAAAQHGAHGHGAGAAAEPHRSVEACEAEWREVVADGRGFGMAFAADRHRYPGPLHVLEWGSRLALTAAQTASARALLEAMFAESRPKGARLLEAERALERLFESGAADAASVQRAVAAVERARAEVRLVHLLTHLRTRALLTDEQLRLYHEARWAR
jgi:hypothetical protein